MAWLLPSVTATLIDSILLALVYLFLFTQYRSRYLGIWTLSWGVYSLRYVFMLVILNGHDTPIFWALHLTAGLYSSVLLYWGTMSFIERPVRPTLRIAVLLGTLWIFSVSWSTLPFVYKTLPVYGLTGTITIWLGIVLVRSQTLPSFVRHFIGYTFMVWGIHLLGYPFLRPIIWFAPWGYELSSILALLAALGSLLLYFQRVRDSLAQSESRYHTLFDSAGDMIIINDLDGNFLEANNMCIRSLGYSRDELLSMTPADIVSDMKVDDVRAITAKVRDEGELVFEVPLKTKSNTSIPAEIYARTFVFDGQPAILCIMRNMTERMKADEARHLSEERFASLVSSIEDIVYTLDTEQRHTGVYGKWVERYGFTPELFLGKTASEIFGPQHTIHEEYNARALNGEYVIYDWTHTDDAGTRHFQTSLAPLHDAVGRITGVVGIGRDITQQKIIEETLRRDERRLEAVLELSSMTDATECGIVEYTVEKCVEFTGSDIGYLHFFDDDQVHLDTFAWSGKVEGLCTLKIPEHYSIDKAGIWVDCVRQRHAVIHNDYQGMPEKQGYPEGHPHIKRHMSVPIFDEGKVVLVAGVGNKAMPYDESDVRQMTVFLNGMWEIVRRRRAEEKLEESDARLRLLADSIVDVISLHDMNGICLYISPSVEILTGFPPDEFIDSTPVKFIHHDDIGQLRTCMNELRATGETEVEWRWKSQVGVYIWLESRGRKITDRDGVTPRILCVSRDITERRRAEKALRDSEERYRRLFNQSGTINLIIDSKTGRIADANARACEFYGYTREQITAMKIDRINTLSMDEIKAEMRKAAKQNRNHFYFQHRLADGSIRDVEVYSTPVLIEDEKFLFSLILDITNQKKLEAQLFQSQKMETVGRLAGGIAHDFNNLLSVIIGNAQLSLETHSCTGTLRSDIYEIIQAAERAADLTRQLLAFSRKQIIRPRVINLNRTLMEMDRMLQRIIGEDVKLVTVPAQDLWYVSMDPGQVEQVITNLAVNARDAMPKGGTLTIETGNVTFDQSFADSHLGSMPGNYVMISVSDTGVGIPFDIQKNIFEPFFTTKSKDKGTGLGLSTCYGIVKQNKGNIWVYSEPGKGATFKVYLPRTAEEAVIEKIAAPSAMPVGTETILLAEDESGLRQLIKRILTGCGYTVHESAHGKEALRLFSQLGPDNFDMIISDVIMPYLGGREFVDKARDLRPDIRVLFISGYTDNAIQHGQILDKSVSFLQKPFTPALLATRVREMLDSAAPGTA